MKTLGLLGFIAFLGFIGVTCLLYSRVVQGLALRWIDFGRAPRVDLAKRFVGSPSYLLSVKVVGAIAILGAAFLLWVFIRNASVAW